MKYIVTLVDKTVYEIEAHDKLAAMIRAIGKAIGDGKSDVILSGKGYHKSGIKSVKEY